jgi:nitrous oxide reductase accessory protein NosL
MKQNRDKQVKSLMVADYATLAVIEAKTATWVVGGKKQGVMTSVPKWAFARELDAQEFVRENGGEVTTFDRAKKAAEDEVGEKTGAHAHHGPGAQMLLNPAFGDDIFPPIRPAHGWSTINSCIWT